VIKDYFIAVYNKYEKQTGLMTPYYSTGDWRNKLINNIIQVRCKVRSTRLDS